MELVQNDNINNNNDNMAATAINDTPINETPINEPKIINDTNQNQDQGNSASQDNLPPIATKDMDVTFVQDVSGSMEDQRGSVVKGINEIITDLQKRYRVPCEHRAHVRIIQFSSHDRIRVGDRVSVDDLPLMDPTDLTCDGMTALWDAVVIAIEQMNTSSAGVPATTYIFTDGDNNDSIHYRQSDVNEMIADNKKRNPMHSILFIGSDPSAKRNAVGMGLDRVHSIQHDSHDTPVAYEVCRRALGRCISGDTQSTEFNDDDIQLSAPASARHSHHTHHAYPAHHDEYDLYGNNGSQPSDDYAFVSDDVASAAPRRAASAGGKL
jgi:uncharacterized protein YegL